MSKIVELAYDIEQLYIDGMSPKQIASELECPIAIVLAWLDSQGVDA
jgi:DNA-directed RNA polymerase specialized sigma24 family protein